MADQRAKRFASNEALFREGNDRMSRWEERRRAAEKQSYLCECADRTCRAKVELTIAEYEHVREDPHRFVVVPGHEIADIEDVVEWHEGWSVIEKVPEPEISEILERSDPRSTGPASPS
jgi:hypothetical protein